MGVSATIGGVPFSAISNAGTVGRYLKAIIASSGDFQTIEYHPPGVTGSYLVLCGEKSRIIVAILMYVDTTANIEANIAADQAAWENPAAGANKTIAYAGKTYSRVRLVPNGMKKIVEPTGYLRPTALAFCEVMATFVAYGGVA